MRILPYLLSYLILLISSCAQQVVPKGGIKDDIPPKIISYKPDNKSTNFKSDKIIIKFDEYINIKDPAQIIISPFLKNKPSIDANGKQINIEFLQSKPEANKTYTINFASSITDVNEGNALNNFAYVFSTGDYLDSNYITGKIINAKTSKDEKDILVALYNLSTFTDTTVFKLFPSYFTKSKENGRFTIENLPNDSFYLLAFKDENSDNKYQETELVAFTETIIKPGIEQDSLQLIMFQNPLHKNNKLLDTLSRQKHLYQFIVYNPTDINISPNKKQSYYSNTVKGKQSIDTIQLFLPNSTDSITEIFNIITADTSYQLSLKTKARSKLLPQQLNIEIPDKPTDSIKIKSNLPIDTIALKNIVFIEDTLHITPKYYKQVSNFEWQIFHPYIEGKGYTIELKDSAYQDVFNRYNSKKTNSFTNKNAKDFGTLILGIAKNTRKNIVLQLIEIQGSDEVIAKEWIHNIPKEATIDNLKPGNYQFKVIVDSNQNATWDTGNYLKNKQAERVYYDKNIIIVKAYWDIEQSINIENIIID